MNSSVHKLIFASSSEQLETLLQKEARTGWRPSKFKTAPITKGILIVLEKCETGRLQRRLS